jgi:hypothetical protein
MTNSIASQDLERHMALVSRHVQVYGVPGHSSLNYEQWLARRRNELHNKLLAGLSYKLVNIKNQGLRRIAFRVEETMTARNGKAVWLMKDIILELEQDEKWRVVEEKIRDWHLVKP